jgi:hypothetical protein
MQNSATARISPTIMLGNFLVFVIVSVTLPV